MRYPYPILCDQPRRRATHESRLKNQAAFNKGDEHSSGQTKPGNMVNSSTIGISSSSDPVEMPSDLKVTSPGIPDSTLDIVGNVSELAELVGVGPGVLGSR